MAAQALVPIKSIFLLLPPSIKISVHVVKYLLNRTPSLREEPATPPLHIPSGTPDESARRSPCSCGDVMRVRGSFAVVCVVVVILHQQFSDIAHLSAVARRAAKQLPLLPFDLQHVRVRQHHLVFTSSVYA